MSSILKALKKIEEDSPPLQVHQTLPSSMASKPVSKSNRGRRRRKIVFLFLLLLVMAIATFMAYSQREMLIAKIRSVVATYAPTADKKPDADRNRVYRAKIPQKSSKPISKPPSVKRRANTQSKKIAPGKRNTSRQVSTKSDSQRAVSAPPQSRKSLVARTPTGAPNARRQRPRKQDRPPQISKPAPKTNVTSTTKSRAPATGTPKPARTRPRENYDRITDSKLKLQALAWAEEADRRMAVINGSIVHEGDSVDGYQILKIRTEDVVVRKSGKAWRLEFGLRQ